MTGFTASPAIALSRLAPRARQAGDAVQFGSGAFGFEAFALIWALPVALFLILLGAVLLPGGVMAQAHAQPPAQQQAQQQALGYALAQAPAIPPGLASAERPASSASAPPAAPSASSPLARGTGSGAGRNAGRGTAKPAGAAADMAPLRVYPPTGLAGLLTVVDGQPVGLYPEFLRRLSEVSGLPMKIEVVPWPDPLKAVAEGRADVLGPLYGDPISFLPDFNLVVSEPIMRAEWSRYIRMGESRLANASSFRGVRIAVLQDSVASTWLTRTHPLAVQVRVESHEEGLRAVLDGKADAYIGLRLSVRSLLNNGLARGIEEAGAELSLPMVLTLEGSKAEYLPRLNEALRTMAAAGEIEALQQRWLPPPPDTAAEVAQRRMTYAAVGLAVLLAAALAVLIIINRRLASTSHMAEQARRAKGEFLAVVSHEIRTPLNGLVNLVDLLQRTRLSPEQGELVQQASAATLTMRGLVNRVLDFSKIEASRLELRPTPTDLASLMERLRTLVSGLPRGEGVSLVFEPLPAPALPRLMLDAQRFEQVLMNLIGNATKFTSQGRITVRVLRLDASPAPGALRAATLEPVRLRFEVEDTGVGIRADQLASIFDPFVQADSGLSRSHEGTGLGLSTCAELVKLMGSTLEVRSELGRGSTFWFEASLLPAPGEGGAGAEAEASLQASASLSERAPHGAAALTASANRAQTLRRGTAVLIVDDNRLNLLVTRKVLTQEGATVHEAAGGAEALVWFDAHPDTPLDVILMDLHMPGLDGVALTQRLRERFGQALPPVLAVSGAVTEEAQSLARAAGMVGFVPKPFDRATLLRAILDVQAA